MNIASATTGGTPMGAGPGGALSVPLSLALAKGSIQVPHPRASSRALLLQVRKWSFGEGRSLAKVTASTRELGVEPESDLKTRVSPTLPLLCFSRRAPPHLSLNVTPYPARQACPTLTCTTYSVLVFCSFLYSKGPQLLGCGWVPNSQAADGFWSMGC